MPLAATFKYRHGTRVVASNASSCDSCHPGSPGNWLPTSNPLGITSATGHVRVCGNCHVAHGSSAIMGAESGAVPFPDNTTAATANARNSLLRLDNRGACAAPATAGSVHSPPAGSPHARPPKQVVRPGTDPGTGSHLRATGPGPRRATRP